MKNGNLYEIRKLQENIKYLRKRRKRFLEEIRIDHMKIMELKNG